MSIRGVRVWRFFYNAGLIPIEDCILHMCDDDIVFLFIDQERCEQVDTCEQSLTHNSHTGGIIMP